MEISAISDRDLRACAMQVTRYRQSTETSTNDDHMRLGR
jgi:hypothetical protein